MKLLINTVRFCFPQIFCTFSKALKSPFRVSYSKLTDITDKQLMFCYMYSYLVSAFDGDLNVVKEAILIGRKMRSEGVEELEENVFSISKEDIVSGIKELKRPTSFVLKINSFWD